MLKRHQIPTQLAIKTDSPGPIYFNNYPLTTRREVWLPCCTSRKSPAPCFNSTGVDNTFTTQEERGVPFLCRYSKSILRANGNLKEDLTSLTQHEKFPDVHVLNREAPASFQMQLEKNHEIPPSTRNEAPIPCSILRAIPSPLSILERRINSLYATQEIPWYTHHNYRGTTTFARNSKIAPCSKLHLEVKADSPASTQEESWLSPLYLTRRPISPIVTREVLSRSCH